MGSNKNVLITDVYDKLMYESVLDSSSVITNTHNELKDNSGILQDAFSAFYKVNPEVNQESSGINRKLIEEMMGMTEYKNIRPSTRLDDIASALAMNEFSSKFVEAFKKAEEEMKEHKNNGGEEEDFKLGSGSRSKIRSGLKKSQEVTDKWNDVSFSFGINPSNDLVNMPIEEKLSLAESLIKNPNVNKMSSILGRLVNMVNGMRSVTPVHGHDEIVDVGQGADLARILPSEFSTFKSKKLLFFKNFLERSLSIYNLRGVDKPGMGPVVMCLDVSGSMGGPREIWSKSIAIALALLCEKQKRDFSIVTFEARVMDTMVFPKGKLSVEDKVKIASMHSSGGGTNFELPLKKSISICEQVKDLKTADIVFITDGECTVNDSSIKLITSSLKKNGIRVYGIGIQVRDVDTMSKFCDRVNVVNDLDSIDSARDLIFNVSMEKKVG